MKAFVIKNKEGKYWQFLYNNESEFLDEIYNAFIHYSKSNAEKSISDFQLQDCEVVEITIAEGDLEQQLAEKDKEIKVLKKDNYAEHTIDYWVRNNIKKQEIYKQLCDELKDGFDNIESNCNTDFDNSVVAILNQIEKGEQVMKENWFVCGDFAINMDKVAAINIKDDYIIIVYDGGNKETCKVEDVNMFASELGKWITK